MAAASLCLCVGAERECTEMLVRAFTCGMGFRGRRSGCRWRCGARCAFRFFIQIDDCRGKVSFFCQDGQRQGREHKHEGCNDGKLAQEVSWAAATENGLARATEGRSNFCPFAGLEQDRSNHEQADDDMDNDQ